MADKVLPVQKYIPNFLSILSNPASSIPKGAQWVVVFGDLSSIMPALKSAISYERSEWSVESAMQTMLGQKFQQDAGCVLCQAIDLPGEAALTNVEGVKMNGFTRTYVGQGRESFPEIRMAFLETNVSFADNFLRPWVLATATHGLISRRKTDPRNYRTDIYCYKLGSSSSSAPPFPLMCVTFFDACCVSVDAEEYNYSTQSGPKERQAKFVFNHYKVDTLTGNKFVAG